MTNSLRASAPVLFGVVGVLGVWMILKTTVGGGGVAPVPAVFDKSVTLEAAIAKSKASGQPVVAFATADWCPPCQQMKRGALVNAEVEGFLRGRTLAVYVDVDGDPEAAGKLSVTGIPATVVIAGDTVVARVSGVMSASDYLGFLRAAVDLANNPAEVEKLRGERGR